MAEDDETPAKSTGAPSESLAQNSEDKDISQLPLDDPLANAERAAPIWDEFVEACGQQGTLATTESGSIDHKVLAAAVALSDVVKDDFLRSQLIEVGVSGELIGRLLHAVRRRRSGRAITLLSAADMMSRPDPQFLVEGVIEERAFAVLYSKPGLGKTFLALAMASCIAAGIPWLGRSVIQGPVIYVCAEGDGGMPKRLRALLEYFGLSGLPVDLHFVTRPVNLMNPESIDELIEEVMAFSVKPVLIVIDTYARCMLEGDENSAKDTGRVVEAIDRLRDTLRTAVLAVHHTGKTGADERGSGALRGAADTMIRLDESDQGTLALIIDKQKNDEESALAVRLKPVGDSLVAEDASAWLAWKRASRGPDERSSTKRPATTEKLQTDILEALQHAESGGRTPISHTGLLKPVRGNAEAKAEALANLVARDNSPVLMEEVGNKKLYSLRH